ncbi:MAG: acetate--CoA ligase family protein [Acidimicrobiales bacterium]
MLTSSLTDTIALIEAARRNSRTVLSEPAAKQVAANFGLEIPKGICVLDVTELPEAARTLRYPLVLKLVSPDVVHKSDMGAVRLALENEGSLIEAARSMLADPRLSAARFEGFLVEEMLSDSLELSIGGTVDAQFGPILMIGVGGIFLEILNDVSVRICPVVEEDVLQMLQELRSYPLLTGARGRVAADLAQLVDAALRVGGAGGILMSLQHEITELDINPLLVRVPAPVAADVRIVVKEIRQ